MKSDYEKMQVLIRIQIKLLLNPFNIAHHLKMSWNAKS